MEKQINTKATKSEVVSSLNLKANNADIIKALSEFSNSIESRPLIEEIRHLLDEKISKNELLYHTNSKATKEEVKNLIEDKIDSTEFKNELTDIKAKLDEYQKKFSQKISQFATDTDITRLQSQINQKANQTEINEVLATKANKEVIMNAINKKSNQADIEAILNNKVDKSDIIQLVNNISMKVDINTYNDSLKVIESKADKKEMIELNKTLNTKAEITDFKLIADAFQDMKGAMGKRIDDIDQDLDSLIDNIKQQFQSVNVVLNNIEVNKAEYSQIDKLNSLINKKIDNDTLSNQINQLKSDVFDALTQYKLDISQNKKKFEDKVNEKIAIVAQDTKNTSCELMNQKETFDLFILNKEKEKETSFKAIEDQYTSLTKDLKKEYENFKSHIINELELRPDKSQYEKLLNVINAKANYTDLENICTKIMNQSKEMNAFLEPKLKELEIRLSKELLKKVSLAEINCILNEKASKSQLDQKIDKDEFNKLTTLYGNLTEIVCNKIDYKNFESAMKNNNIFLNEMQTELSSKANIKEMMTLLKTKAEVDDVNKALIEIHEELDSKSNADQFNTAMDNQAIINDALCSENCVGRWMWKSGKVKNGYAIPWEYQSANTAPDNFIWEKDRPFIQVILSGVYKFTIGIYGNKMPNVSISVNGEAIISASNYSNHIINRQSSKGQISKSLSQIITGLTLTEYIIIPDKSKISVIYLGDENAVGFLDIKKL